MNALAIEDSRARLFVERPTWRLISSTAERRQHHRGSVGAHAPAALGQAPVDIRRIVERVADGVEEKTSPGHHTAERRLPPVLAGLDRADQRRRAAHVLADVCERIESVRGSNLEGTDETGLISDVGVTTRVALAATLFLIKATVNDWTLDRANWRFFRGPELVVLSPRNTAGDRHPIKAMTLLRQVCVEHRSMRYVLEAHGWSDQPLHKRVLMRATLYLLDLVACELFAARRRSH